VCVLSLHGEQALSFAHLLERNIRYQEDLIDQHCNSSEKRPARILLLLARKNTPDSLVPKLDQTTLAQMVGTTRSRVSFFITGSDHWATSIVVTAARIGSVCIG
jgi:hypothetical protein